MAITFDVLDRFQENKAFQTVQIMNNYSEVKQKVVALSPWKPLPFKVRGSEKYLFGFNHSNYVVKTEFFKKSSRTLILATCYRSIQSYF